MKESLIVLMLVMFLYGLMTPALGISVGFSAGNGGEIVSSSSAYDLDISTSLQESATLADGGISKDLTASGSGNNRISISSSANDKFAETEIESSGNFQTSAFTGASGGGVEISQDTAMSGRFGGITYRADSPENKMVISSGFEGQGNLAASASATAGIDAAISGNVNAQGVEMLDSESLQALASGEVAMSVDGLYSTPNGGLGNFGLVAENTKKGAVSSHTSALLIGPELTENGGNANAYALSGFRWNTRDPQLRWVLKNDAYLTGEGLSVSAVQNAIVAAATTWDDASNQNLFADANMVALDPSIAVTFNRINSVSFAPSKSVCLATARTFYDSNKVDGLGGAIDSDIIFNTNYNWCTSGPVGNDFQSIALHEMGHTLGLADLYNKPQFALDGRQVMHYYTGVKRTLGNGDKTGVWKLYH